MINKSSSIFQLLTIIEQTFRSYSQNSYEIQDVDRIYKELGNLKLNSEKIFQQLLPSRDKFFQLKYCLYQHIMTIRKGKKQIDLQIQADVKINYFQDSSLQDQSPSEILRKISALKGEAMFINQQLSIQPINYNLSEDTICKLKQLSLRKLIKANLQKNKQNSNLQFLQSLCVRLIVLQETLITSLEKSMTFLHSIIRDDSMTDQQVIVKTQNTKSVSSLSASIEQFIQNKNKSIILQNRRHLNHRDGYENSRPVIKSDFVLIRTNTNSPNRIRNGISPHKNYCMWF